MIVKVLRFDSFVLKMGERKICIFRNFSTLNISVIIGSEAAWHVWKIQLPKSVLHVTWKAPIESFESNIGRAAVLLDSIRTRLEEPSLIDRQCQWS